MGEVSVKVCFFTLQTAAGFSSRIRIILKEMVPTELHIHACTMKADNKAEQNKTKPFPALSGGQDKRCCHKFWMTSEIPQDDERSAKGARLSPLGAEGLHLVARLKIPGAFIKIHAGEERDTPGQSNCLSKSSPP